MVSDFWTIFLKKIKNATGEILKLIKFENQFSIEVNDNDEQIYSRDTLPFEIIGTGVALPFSSRTFHIGLTFIKDHKFMTDHFKKSSNYIHVCKITEPII